MSTAIDRISGEQRFALDGDLKSPIMGVPGKAGGGLIAESDFGGDGAEFLAGPTRDNVAPLYDGSGSVVSVQISANQAVPIPEDVMKFAFIQVLATGVGAAQGQHMRVSVKS